MVCGSIFSSFSLKLTIWQSHEVDQLKKKSAVLGPPLHKPIEGEIAVFTEMPARRSKSALSNLSPELKNGLKSLPSVSNCHLDVKFDLFSEKSRSY